MRRDNFISLKSELNSEKIANYIYEGYVLGHLRDNFVSEMFI